METGSVADWVQIGLAVLGIVLTIASLLILQITLKQQMEVNRAQFRLLEIESNRLSREIRPFFTLSIDNFDNVRTFKSNLNPWIEYEPYPVEFKITCKLNSAYRVQLSIHSSEFLKQTSNDNTVLKLGLNFIGDVQKDEVYHYKCLMHDNFHNNWYIFFNLTFYDEDGRQYTQELQYDSINGVIFSNPPLSTPLTRNER